MGLTTKKTHEEFTSLLSDKFPNIITEDIYQTAKIKMKFKCKVDNYEWTTTPDVILRSKGCPKCNRVAKLTNDEFINRIKLNNPNYDNIEILSSYINLKNKIRCKCKIDGYEWDAMPDKLMSNSGCPKCGGTLKLTHNEFVAKLNNSEKFKNIELLSEYEVQRKKIKCRCKVDGHEWFVLPQSLLKGHGCHMCNDTIGEKKVSEVLDSMNIEYLPQYRFDNCRHIRPLPFDFYLPKLNICIEYDGQQHYRPVTFGGCTIEQAIESHENTLMRDNIKNQYCKNNNIKLIRIKYSDYNNIESIIQNAIC